MKNNRFAYACMAAVALLAASCSNDEEGTAILEDDGRVAVQFSAGNIATLETKAWTTNYDIGLSMISAEGEPSVISSNAYYKNSSRGEEEVNLTPNSTSETIYYPTDGSDVSFNAYIPRQENANIVDNELTFDIPDIYPFYTATAAGPYNETTTENVSLSFEHRLSLIRINVTGSDYSPSRTPSTLSDQVETLTYNLLTNEITFSEDDRETIEQTYYNGEQIDFYVYPEATTGASSATLTIIVEDKETEEDVSFTATLPYPDGGFQAGKIYYYTVTLTKARVEGLFVGKIEEMTTETMGSLEATKVTD